MSRNGIHELVKEYFEEYGTVLDRHGELLGNMGGLTARASKFIDHPREQILSYSHETGKVMVWADRNAKDNTLANERYNHPFYRINHRLTACGYHLFNLGGI